MSEMGKDTGETTLFLLYIDLYADVDELAGVFDDLNKAKETAPQMVWEEIAGGWFGTQDNGTEWRIDERRLNEIAVWVPE